MIKNTHTFSIHFWLKKKSIRNYGTIPIYLRVRLDGISACISTKESIREEHWCPDTQRVNVKVKNANFINDALDDISSEIKNAYRALL